MKEEEFLEKQDKTDSAEQSELSDQNQAQIQENLEVSDTEKPEELIHEIAQEVVKEVDQEENTLPETVVKKSEDSVKISEEELEKAIEDVEEEPASELESEPVSESSLGGESSENQNQLLKKKHHEHIYDLLTNQDEITWKSIIVELIKTEQMDPWDVNVSLLSKMYIKTIRKLKEMNLQLSGKVILAADLLLRIKSARLVSTDLMEFDRLLVSGEQNEDMLYEDGDYASEDLPNGIGINVDGEDLKLMPKTPQPRQRKVSMYDLIDALAIALNVRRRRILNQVKVKEMNVPEHTFDLSEHMDYLFGLVLEQLSKGSDRVNFKDLVPDNSRLATIHTFIPLLHLTNARKTDLEQKVHFGDVWVSAVKKDKQEKLSGESADSEEAIDS